VDKLKKFFILGMPEAVVTLLEQQDVEKTQQVLQNIVNAYVLTFRNMQKVRMYLKLIIFGSIPHNWQG